MRMNDTEGGQLTSSVSPSPTSPGLEKRSAEAVEKRNREIRVETHPIKAGISVPAIRYSGQSSLGESGRETGQILGNRSEPEFGIGIVYKFEHGKMNCHNLKGVAPQK